jgi:hypothetical protein
MIFHKGVWQVVVTFAYYYYFIFLELCVKGSRKVAIFLKLEVAMIIYFILYVLDFYRSGKNEGTFPFRK